MNGRLGGEGSEGCEDSGSLRSMLVSRVATDEVSDLPQAQCTQQERLMRFLPPCLQSHRQFAETRFWSAKLRLSYLGTIYLLSVEARHRIGQFGNCVAEKSCSATTTFYAFLFWFCLVFASAFQRCFFIHHAFTTSGVPIALRQCPSQFTKDLRSHSRNSSSTLQAFLSASLLL